MELLDQIENWKKEGLKIVFTNGVFDILHRGHVTYLNEAKKLGDKLIVGINSDSSVKKLEKGKDRPINDEESRAFILENLKSIDGTIIFSEDTPYHLISKIKPSVLVKGGDYDPEESDPNSKTYIVGSDIVKNNGGEIVSIDLVKGFSTTNIIRKIKD